PKARVTAVQESDPVSSAARVMVEKRLTRLPVLRMDRVVGYLTRADILRAARAIEDIWARRPLTDEQITHLAQQTILRCPHLEHRDFHVQTRHGVVRTSGIIGSTASIQHLNELMLGLPGVKAVEHGLLVEGLLR
ncbi:MAG TPA: CBS domain-containing protein, partial [Candidatus Xenobia bacterium]